MAATDSDDPRSPMGRSEQTALVIIDMLNDYDHPDGAPLQESAREVVPVIAGLVERARAAGTAVIWVNDNHGTWSAGRAELVEQARAGAGAEMVDPIAPPDDAPFVVKARHSAFYGSHLEYLLSTEGIGRLVLVGQVTEQCILYSALDAYIRHFQIVVPRDGVACIDPELADAALRMMERNMRAEVADADDIEL
jgi:nicotinamidase-related amidase